MKFVLIGGLAILAIVVVIGLVFFRGALAGGSQHPTESAEGSLWDLPTRTLEGVDAELKQWQGQVALVVNVASKCGLTPQYTGLEALYQELQEQGLVVLGFPSNDFMGQEPGTPEEIREFCNVNYDITFPLFEKVKVKGGQKCEIYRFLTAGGLEEPTWNFTKYLVGRDGKVIARFGPKTAPDDDELRRAIADALGNG